LKKSTLIYNPVAGRHPARREKQVRQAVQTLARAGFEVDLAPTAKPGDAEQLARAAALRGLDLVTVCGGDGTINEVINGLAPSSTPLAILPGGTANILAKELGLPHNPVRAAACLPCWLPHRIALGMASWSLTEPADDPAKKISTKKVRQRYYISVAGVGFDAHIVYKLSWGLKVSWGVAGYILEAFRQAFAYPFPAFSCQVDGRELRSTFAVVHRTRLYAGWLHLAPTAGLFEPRLTVCAFPSRRWTRYLLYATTVLARQHLRLKDVELVQGNKVTCSAVEARTTIRFELDGELVGTLPVTFEVVPDALTILAP
jgi:diacylglycerol kinase (ATP)